MKEPDHIRRGRLTSATLKESDVKQILLKILGYYFEWGTSSTLDGWLHNIAYSGGTFGDFYGGYDTGAKTCPFIKVDLKDGRVFKFNKADFYNNRTVQGALL